MPINYTKDAYIESTTQREEHDALLFDVDKIFHEYSCTSQIAHSY